MSALCLTLTIITNLCALFYQKTMTVQMCTSFLTKGTVCAAFSSISTTLVSLGKECTYCYAKQLLNVVLQSKSIAAGMLNMSQKHMAHPSELMLVRLWTAVSDTGTLLHAE